MKKNILLFFIVLVAFHVSAQTIDSIPHYNLGPHSAQASTYMKMSDGSILDGILIADEYPFDAIGYVMHKVSQHDSGLAVTNTLFLPYEQLPWHLTAKDPQGEGNILAEFYDYPDQSGCALKIRRFDNELHLDTTETIVPLADFYGGSTDPFLDPNDDIVFSYYDYSFSPSVYNIVRIGLDGTIKHQISHDSLGFLTNRKKHLKLFCESPLTYCYWGTYYEQLKEDSAVRDYVYCYLLDSLFNVTKLYILPRMSDSPDYVNYKNDGYTARLMGWDNGCFFESRSYNRSYNLYPFIEDDGVAVMKYDSDFNLLARRKFLSEPYLQYTNYGARPIGLERSKDGYIYFAYFTHDWYKPSQVSVVKMDSDLNIIWQRHCLEREKGRLYGNMLVLDDNSVAVMGTSNITDATGNVEHSETFYIIVHDDYDALGEQGIIVRPYAYYPNPAQDELHLHYSPDVTPTQIELYDLQGRLVRTQRNGLENLEMNGLPSGAYTMRVMLEDGKVFSDKVIRE